MITKRIYNKIAYVIKAAKFVHDSSVTYC